MIVSALRARMLEYLGKSSQCTIEGYEVVAFSSIESDVIFSTTHGELYAYGDNYDGQLGFGDCQSRSEPILIPFSQKVVMISLDSSQSAIITTRGHVYTCGCNYFGQLGLGDNLGRTRFTSTGQRAIAVSVGTTHTLLLSSTGKVWSTGSNTYGELSLGNRRSRNRFTKVSLPGSVTSIFASQYRSSLITTTGQQYRSGAD